MIKYNVSKLTSSKWPKTHYNDLIVQAERNKIHDKKLQSLHIDQSFCVMDGKLEKKKKIQLD